MTGSYSDTAWTVNEICDFRTLSFDSIYNVIINYFYPGLWKAPFSLKVGKCDSFHGRDKKYLSMVSLWLALGKITKQGTLVFDASLNSLQWASIRSWYTDTSQGP